MPNGWGRTMVSTWSEILNGGLEVEHPLITQQGPEAEPLVEGKGAFAP